MLNTTITALDRYRGCLLGGAVGDALGAAVEFDDVRTIRVRFGRHGILAPATAYGRIGAITDDTQMTLFTAEGLLQADDLRERGVGRPVVELWFAYQRWLQTQGITSYAVGSQRLSRGELHRVPELRARRAPGTTCLSSLERGLDALGDRFVARNDSKGCGGVMRAAPCGLVRRWGDDGALRIGVASAALTHGHATGHLAAGALAVLIASLRRGESLHRAVAHTIDAIGQRRGSHEVVRSLVRAQALAVHGGAPDVSRLGAGWVAEEALAIAVYCALVHPTDFAAGVRLAANHSGDSDSTAAIAGNIMGTHLGVRAVPGEWLAVLELRDTIDRLATAMHDRFVLGRRDVGWDLGRRRREAPPHDAYWVEPGRLLAGPYPGAKAGVEARQKLQDFLEVGVTCFIDLTEEGEGNLEPYTALLRRIARERGVAVNHLRMPIRDVDVCPEWEMRAIQAAVDAALAAGEVVYVHCWGGVGRTGTVIGCRLVEQGAATGAAALEHLQRLRARTQRAHRRSPETSAQRQVVREWSSDARGRVAA